jgi:hypothetical protein
MGTDLVYYNEDIFSLNNKNNIFKIKKKYLTSEFSNNFITCILNYLITENIKNISMTLRYFMLLKNNIPININKLFIMKSIKNIIYNNVNFISNLNNKLYILEIQTNINKLNCNYLPNSLVELSYNSNNNSNTFYTNKIKKIFFYSNKFLNKQLKCLPYNISQLYLIKQYNIKPTKVLKKLNLCKIKLSYEKLFLIDRVDNNKNKDYIYEYSKKNEN